MQFRPSAVVRQGMAAAITATLACLVAPAAARAQNAYITNFGSNTVSVIATTTNTPVNSPIPVGPGPFGVAVTPDGNKVYVTNRNSSTVSVIATATNAVVGDPIQVGSSPAAFGLFIQPAKAPFAGKPGTANCGGQSVSTLARHYGGLSAAARALRYASVAALQAAVATYCNG
jgi:YVTN family beta-propeller protein